jgi:hypothetical protein
MKFMPPSRRGRVLASAWFALCLLLLVFAFARRDMPDMPPTFTWVLIALSFPLGLPSGAIVGRSMSWLYAHHGLAYDPFTDLLPSWLAMVAAGYLQWFMLVPAIARRSSRLRRGA